MELALKTCCIRPWVASDAPAIQRHANNRKIWANLRDVFPHPYSLDSAHAFLRTVMGQRPVTTFALATADEAVGCIGLELGRDVHFRTAELGYWLGETYWGRGIMTEAVGTLTQWAFQNLDLDRISAEVFVTSQASARVLEKNGYVLEGRLRARVFKDGKRLDSLLYARTQATGG